MPRSLKLKLTLDTPADLKVKQGDVVVQGQVLCDRVSVRKDLMGQQRSLLIQLGRLKERGVIPDRPMPSFGVEQAKIDGAKFRVNQAKGAIADFWAHLPYTHTAWSLLALPNERAKLASLEAQLSQAQVDLKLALAQLQLAKEEHQVSVYKSKDHLENGREQEQVLARLQEVEGKLGRVEVRSPYSGRVKKIKWLGQADQVLLAEATIVVEASD